MSRAPTGRLRSIFDYLRTSFWFVPTSMVFLSFALIFGALRFDNFPAGRASSHSPWWLYVGAPETARDLISTVLSSMITMAALVFSITMVVLSLAASQYGPRLVRNFMASPLTQFVLGTFVMTIVYCLLLLLFIGRLNETDPVSLLTVSIALGLTLLSVILLVAFIDSLAKSIVSETVVERVGRELDVVLGSMRRVEDHQPNNSSSSYLPPVDHEQSSDFFGVEKAGYVQALEIEQLTAAAAENDVLLRLNFRAGDYVVEGGRSIAVYPGGRSTKDLIATVRRAVVIGVHRTPVQDPEFSIRHLVEIAVRALSPGINDPYTAVAVINQLSASLSHLMSRSLPPGLFRDHSGIPRVLSPAATYQSLIGAAFDQIRQHGADQPIIVIHMLEAIERIADHLALPAQVEAVEAQLKAIAQAGHRRTIQVEDRDAVTRRFESARMAVAHAAAKLGAGSDVTRA
jgi:uncharacterized membrane protein